MRVRVGVGVRVGVWVRLGRGLGQQVSHRGRRLAVAPHALLPLGIALVAQALGVPVEVEVVVEVLQRRQGAVVATPFIRPLQLLEGEGRDLVSGYGYGC